MGKIYTLSDGTKIELSDRKSNRSGYTGAALSPSWTLDPSRPFIAACANPTDPAIMGQMRAQNRTAWHGGIYEDAREAAYVVALFKEDPIHMDQMIGEMGTWDRFPADLYGLPVITSADDARAILTEAKDAKPARKTTKLKDVDLPANEGFWKKHSKDVMDQLLKKHGRSAVQQAIRHLTLREFEELFEIQKAA